MFFKINSFIQLRLLLPYSCNIIYFLMNFSKQKLFILILIADIWYIKFIPIICVILLSLFFLKQHSFFHRNFILQRIYLFSCCKQVFIHFLHSYWLILLNYCSSWHSIKNLLSLCLLYSYYLVTEHSNLCYYLGVVRGNTLDSRINRCTTNIDGHTKSKTYFSLIGSKAPLGYDCLYSRSASFIFVSIWSRKT